MKKTTTIFTQSLVGLIPIFYLASIWHILPESVPLHYHGSFEPDRFGKKSELLFVQLILLFISIGVSLLILNIDKFDPKQRYAKSNSTMLIISWVLIVFLTLLSVLIIYQTKRYCTKDSAGNFSSKYIFAIFCLFFVVLGNFMNSIKPNYFVGIRTPWALENEANWRKTHAFGSKVWFFAGLLMLILIIALPEDGAEPVFTVGLIPIVAAPIAYSYYLFVKQKKNKQEPKVN